MKKKSLSYMFHLKIISVFVVSLLIICFCGCEQSKQRTFGGRMTPKNAQISKDQLRASLNTYEEFLRASVKETIDKIDEIDSTARTRKINMIMRTRTLQGINTMLEQNDPVIAYLEIWGFVVRLNQFLEDGEASTAYGENQPVLIEMTAKLKTRIETIGKTFMTDEVFEETKKQIYNFARSNPMKGVFSNSIVYATRIEPGKPIPFEGVIGIPMAPITAMKGVDRTATAVNNFSNTAAGFSDIVEDLPESARWQLLALIYDLEETEMTKSFLASMSKFSDSSEQLAESTKNLPQDIRKQISILIEEIDNKQANLQATLDKVQETLASADKTAASFQTTAVDVSQAANAWDKAANSTQQALSEFGKLKSTRKNQQEEPAFKIKDVQNIVETANQTVGEMQNITIQIRDIVESKQLADYASMPKELVNLLAWRLGQLIVLIFVLAFVYRIVVCRLVKK